MVRLYLKIFRKRGNKKTTPLQTYVCVCVGLWFICTACGQAMVVHRTDEREANRIIEVLADQEPPIVAQKGRVDTGREVYFTISVPGNKRLTAIKVLNAHQLPAKPDKGYELFTDGEGGLIPTNVEERGKLLASLEGEIQRQLRLVDGVLDVQVQIVLPEEDALRAQQGEQPQPSASVTVKYLPARDKAGRAQPPLSTEQVARIVAAGVEKLKPEDVVVVMTQARAFERRGVCPRPTDCRPAKGFWAQSPSVLNAVAIVVIGVVFLLGLGLAATQLRLRVVRGRFIRLQTEIAKARRRPENGPIG